jgi:phenylalanyl-tRNA synthetase beta chain
MLEVPHHKRDIYYGADLVEEILRIDGLDNIDIPVTITITPSVEEDYTLEALKEKTATTLVGLGFTEILTNSITNSRHFSEAELTNTVKLLNNISVELDVLRPAMLPTALEVIAHNINRKVTNLKFFEFGKTYRTSGAGMYEETNHFCLYVTGNNIDAGWKAKAGDCRRVLFKRIGRKHTKSSWA